MKQTRTILFCRVGKDGILMSKKEKDYMEDMLIQSIIVLVISNQFSAMTKEEIINKVINLVGSNKKSNKDIKKAFDKIIRILEMQNILVVEKNKKIRLRI